MQGCRGHRASNHERLPREGQRAEQVKCKEHGEGDAACAKCLSIQAKAPIGHNSVHGKASAAGSMNYDEPVVHDEAAVLPYMVVHYRFRKLK